MTLDDRSAWALLRQLDDPDHMEFPRGYDHAGARARFDRLAARPDERFRCSCTVDRYVQDASHHGTITVPEAATAFGDHLTVTVSNFGDLTTMTFCNPGSHDEGGEGGVLQAFDRHRVDAELEALGYVAIPEHLLRTEYDGVSDLLSYYPPEDPPTWRTRFFHYL
ncbi:hypothetical protein ACFWJ4_15335 [Kitasatospora sp. NPDC127067]|uniref:hypothetical protein n=1 Tax=Kitasatospora sp. NPDC127067 TaxID=3347126 RepID=UPI0036661F09